MVFVGWGVAVAVGRGVAGGPVIVLGGAIAAFGDVRAPLQAVNTPVIRMAAASKVKGFDSVRIARYKMA